MLGKQTGKYLRRDIVHQLALKHLKRKHGKYLHGPVSYTNSKVWKTSQTKQRITIKKQNQ